MKKAIKASFLKLKGDKLLKHLNKSPRVLFWHGVDEITDPRIEAESFDVNSFVKQIDYLTKNYEIISINEFNYRLKNDCFSNNEIVLTFDDGYANNLYKVAPILNKRSIPFTVFISTEHIETGTLYPTSVARLILLGSKLKKVSIPTIKIDSFDISTDKSRYESYRDISNKLKKEPLDKVKKIVNELISNISTTEFKRLIEKYSSVKPMNWEEVKKLYGLGITIGSHCQYHICCHHNQEVSEVRKQITDSKVIIENKLQAECNYFAYPNGDYTEASNSIVKEAGYSLGFSTNKNARITSNTERTIIPRIGVPGNVDTFKLFVNLYPKA